MARITGDNLKPEAAVKFALKGARIKFRANVKSLPGSPDIVVGRTALFVHGCFWHGCPAHYRRPKSNRRFWSDKLASNRRRDARAARRLRAMGYSVLTAWECSVRNSAGRLRLISRLR